MKIKIPISIAYIPILLLSACGPGQVVATPTMMSTSTATSIPSPTATLTAMPPPGISVLTSTDCTRGPGDTYDVVTSFEEGDQAEIVGRDETGSYWIIKNPDGEGGCWIESQAVTAEGELGYTPYLIPPPTPTPAAPAPPENVSAEVTCSWVYVCVRKWGSSCARWDHRHEVNIKLSWEDNADNETGYQVFKNGYKLASLQANTTEYSDWFAGFRNFKGTNHYTIQAFDLVSVSTPVDIKVDYLCPKIQ